jgi:endonuclease YncB( thermonuclease family)
MKDLALACAALLWIFCASSLQAEPISADAIAVVDGDTIDVGPDRYRLVGFDTPEIRTPRRKVSADERALATIASERLTELLRSGALELTEVRCSCPASKIGTKQCNIGRKCGVLTLDGKNIGATLITEELAVPYKCRKTSCPRMPDWPRIIESQFPLRR